MIVSHADLFDRPAKEATRERPGADDPGDRLLTLERLAAAEAVKRAGGDVDVSVVADADLDHR
jgi:hypothetical protein